MVYLSVQLSVLTEFHTYASMKSIVVFDCPDWKSIYCPDWKSIYCEGSIHFGFIRW